MGSSHPLADTFAKLNAANPYYTLEIGAQEGERWLTTSDLFDHGAFDAIAASILTQFPQATRRYIGSRVLTSLAWLSNLAGLGSYLIAQRVPDISWANLKLHWREEGWANCLTVITPRFYVLPDDPAADHEDALVVLDKDALRAVCRLQIESSIEAVLAPLKTRSSLGKPAIWGTAADCSVSMIMAVARTLNCPELCDTETAAFVHAAGSPLNGKSDVLWVECDDRREPFLDRGSCCLWYTVADEANSYCSTCPLVAKEERINQFRAQMRVQMTMMNQ